MYRSSEASLHGTYPPGVTTDSVRLRAGWGMSDFRSHDTFSREEEKKGGSKGGRLIEEDRLRMKKGEKRIKIKSIGREISKE
jgi:hypothetical protein